MPNRRYRLAQRRKAVGLSQERLAEVMGVDRSTVVRWERADTDPQPWHRPRLATALRLSVEELAELLADVGEPPSRPNERLDYVLKHPGRVDLIAVAYLREQVQRLDEQYEHLPSTLLLAETGQLHGRAVFLREHATSGPVRRELAAAVVESATLMGQLVWDASQRRDHSAAVGYFDQAITAAQQTRDVVAEAHAELRKSYVALYGTGNPATGLALAHRAAEAAVRPSVRQRRTSPTSSPTTRPASCSAPASTADSPAPAGCSSASPTRPNQSSTRRANSSTPGTSPPQSCLATSPWRASGNATSTPPPPACTRRSTWSKRPAAEAASTSSSPPPANCGLAQRTGHARGQR
jgi:transcriptional regulator with XRE-family HTH domain